MPASRTLTSVLLCSLALSIGECSDGGRRLSHARSSRSSSESGLGSRPGGERSGLDPASLKEGDLIFHRSNSSQSEAIRIATQSKFNHVGIIFQYKGQFMVFEAVQPVKITPLPRFIERGNHHFVIKRLRDGDRVLSAEVIARMKALGQGYLGKNYDLQFRWSDERIYCSELVWKLYKQGAGVEVGTLQKARDLNLGNPVVQKLIKQRYGDAAAIPLDEPIISPQAMFESDRLVTVAEK